MKIELGIVLGVSLLLLFGYLGGQAAKKFKIPAVAGYCIAGVLIGPSFLNLITDSLNQDLDIIKILGLGMIALIIGGELKYSKIKKLGKSIVVITIFQVLFTFAAVLLGIKVLLGEQMVTALLLASLATATAPAATIAVIKEYRAKGTVTSTLLGVIALDDALCIIIVGLIVSLVKVFIFNTGILILSDLIIPFREIIGSLIVGSFSGFLIFYLLKYIHEGNEILIILLSMVFFNSGTAHLLELSPLLTNMVCGFVSVNLSSKPFLMHLENIEIPIFVAFFTLAGASLHLNYLLTYWMAATVYVISRALGKVYGCYLGAKVTSSSENVRKYLGLAMLPKAGVSIGLILFIQSRFPGMELIAVITAIELAAVTFFEIVGPLFTKFALDRSGEIKISEDKQVLGA